ncbi:response regulator [Paenibacillus sp. L3-i20]|uniref:response regulator n=1 Tax=Paenibacillus sp. L3-i20 TaxID=2905833 RepID=UPI001EDEFC17|nr:response regulator [Paenibacillus sp. L3-i20]GKU76493.1 hypothetical protein L3i20_v208900 [Paenibacillus sp. L3-i20]
MYKLLIVDDEPLTREYIKLNIHLLHNQWICAGEASDGKEALDLIEGGAAFDLIMTDIKMPIMTGIELARKISLKHPKTRMIIISGYDEFSLAKEAMHYGVHDYLLKPLVREELVSVLGTVASELAAEQLKQDAYRSLVSLSEESREQIARNALRAIITDNYIETKVLYPMLHRLKISLIEAEGAIMIVDLDDAELRKRDLSLTDQALYRYIVHQTAAELTVMNSGQTLFVDNDGRTTLLITGEDGKDVGDHCLLLFQQLSEAIRHMTGLPLWGAIGTPEIDVLQLAASYKWADTILKTKRLKGPPSLLSSKHGNNETFEDSKTTDKSIISPQFAMKEEHETITKVKEYIFDHFAEPLSLALIADKMRMSPGYLSSLFHQQTDESYIKFLTRVRMEHAATLLRKRPSEKVYDVAEKVGYVSVKHFSYVFKGHFGMPPGVFQERALRQ